MNISAEVAKSRKMKDPVRYFYYDSLCQQENLLAAVSWEQFKGSWAYEQFMIKNHKKIVNMVACDNNRFPRTWKENMV